jgi:predicted metal-dependent hydrolase
MTRERNAAGRPEQARPRDATGKPLERGSGPSWRERLRALDEARALPPQEALDEAERLVLTGQPFYAHEVLEGPWHLAEPAERAFWQGLAQVAVGLTHVQRGNATGAVSILRSGAEKLRRYADGHEGVAAQRVAAAAEALAQRVERDGTDAVAADDLLLPFR